MSRVSKSPSNDGDTAIAGLPSGGKIVAEILATPGVATPCGRPCPIARKGRVMLAVLVFLVVQYGSLHVSPDFLEGLVHTSEARDEPQKVKCPEKG